MKTVPLSDRIKIIDYLREKAKKKSPPITYERLIKELNKLFGCDIGKNTIKSCCRAGGINLDDVVERESTVNGSPVSLLHVKIAKLENKIKELEERIHRVSLWTDYAQETKEEV